MPKEKERKIIVWYAFASVPLRWLLPYRYAEGEDGKGEKYLEWFAEKDAKKTKCCLKQNP